LVQPPVPIAAPEDALDPVALARILLLTIMMLSIIEAPLETAPPPIAAPFCNAEERTSALAINKRSTTVVFPLPAKPAPIPVPPEAVMEAFIISSDLHMPFDPVPIPEAEVPPPAVSEPFSLETIVTFDSKAHSRPVEYVAVFLSTFEPSRTTVTELSEMRNGF
jgi:hypothetical protein